VSRPENAVPLLDREAPRKQACGALRSSAIISRGSRIATFTTDLCGPVGMGLKELHSICAAREPCCGQLSLSRALSFRARDACTSYSDGCKISAPPKSLDGNALMLVPKRSATVTVILTPLFRISQISTDALLGRPP
jgi:hypothetical protein